MTFARFAAAAAIALATAATPVPAQSAAPLSVAASIQRSGAGTAHSNRLWNDYWVPLGIFAAVIIAIIVLNNKSNKDLPRSP